MQSGDRRILNYWLVEELGHDRLGRVFRAEEGRMDRTVVLRLLRVAGVAPPDRVEVARAALRKRIRAAAAVVHSSLAAVLDHAAHEDLEVLAIEDVQGRSMTDFAARGDLLPLDEVLRHATRIAAGLAMAHARGVTHGRISPGNIRLARDGNARLLDLGIPRPTEVAYHLAGVADGNVLETERLRDVHAFARTVQYMVTGNEDPGAMREAKNLPGLGGAIIRAVAGVIEGHGASMERMHEWLVEVGRTTPADPYVSDRPVVIPTRRFPPVARPAPISSDPGMELPPLPAPIAPAPIVRPAEPAATPAPMEEVLTPPAQPETWSRPFHASEPPAAPAATPLLVPEPRPYRHSLGHRLTGALRERRLAVESWFARLPLRSALQFAGSAAAGAVIVLVAVIAFPRARAEGGAGAAVPPASELATGSGPELAAPVVQDAQQATLTAGPPVTASAAETESPPAPAPAPPPPPPPPEPAAEITGPSGNPQVGGLRITVTPRGALVRLDDGAWLPAPVNFTHLTPGVYRLRIRREGFEERSETVTVRAGETTRRTIDLTVGAR